MQYCASRSALTALLPPNDFERVDVHQHVWTDALVGALSRRSAFPRVRRLGGDAVLELAGERPWPLDLVSERPASRAALLEADGVDRALVCLSSPLGIEALPRDEAQPVLDAFHDGAFALPDGFRVWGAIALEGSTPADVDVVLARGAVGLSLPADALATPERIERLGPVLERLERAHSPLLVHPGPARLDDAAGLPGWWPAVNDYVAGQVAAWHAFVAAGRRSHPSLRVVFAMLAGLAPVHAERLAARGGPAAEAVEDPLLFYDTSSYGSLAIRAVASVVGWSQIVYGSDRPVVDPGGVPPTRCVTVDNPARAIGRQVVWA